jgi:hypothetical protein
MAAQRAGASRRTGLSPSGDPLRLGERSMPVSKALGTVARAWAREAGGRATRPSWKTIGAGPAARLLRAGRPARAEGLAGLGLSWWSLAQARAALKCCALDNFVFKGFHPIASP